jgi:hypothetical protein
MGHYIFFPNNLIIFLVLFLLIVIFLVIIIVIVIVLFLNSEVGILIKLSKKHFSLGFLFVHVDGLLCNKLILAFKNKVLLIKLVLNPSPVVPLVIAIVMITMSYEHQIIVITAILNILASIFVHRQFRSEVNCSSRRGSCIVKSALVCPLVISLHSSDSPLRKCASNRVAGVCRLL